MSVKKIAARVGVAVSSVSVWVRDVETPPPVTATPPDPPPPTQHAERAAEGPARRCGRCEHVLPLAAFNRRGTGHQHWCRECFRVYQRERRDVNREQVRASTERRRWLARAFVLEHLRSRSCADCGEDELLVLEFDHHRGRKTANIGDLLARGARVERLRAEIGHCEVVCVSCHRRRTARRAGHFRATRVPPASWDAYQRRNNLYLLELLDRSPCVDCGENDSVVLEFDHVDGKRADVTRLAMGCGLERLEREIARCEIRCANCHRLRTLAAGSWRAEGHWATGLHDVAA
jgi:hypothetical protein